MKRFKNLLLFGSAWCGLLAMAPSAPAQTWRQTSAPYGSWTSVASSADGSKLVATGLYIPGCVNGEIYTSKNFGSSWTSNNVSDSPLYYVGSSADGAKLVAATINGSIYLSTNSGTVWILTTNLPAFNQPGTSIVSSADGSKLIVAYPEGVFRSVDSGITWISNSVTTNNLHWLFLALSADASVVVAADNYGYIYTSTNSGADWIQTSAPLGNWQGIASSADGKRLVAVDQGFGPGWLGNTGNAGPIYISTNAGLTWTSNNMPSQIWIAVASSADGRMLAAAAYDTGSGAPIYISTNSGESWTPEAVSNQWGCIASSADGTKLVAAIGNLGVYDGTEYSFADGTIWTSQNTSPPQLNIARANGNLAISWIVPSANFVIQQSSNLQIWADMTNQPVLNLTNLQNEMILSPSGSNVFYRLKTP
jgi:hypothetical protein